MPTSDRAPSTGLSRRILLTTALACGLAALAAPVQAQIKSLEIIAPAGPGGGYDQLARATQEVLQAKGLASGVQVVNIQQAAESILTGGGFQKLRGLQRVSLLA